MKPELIGPIRGLAIEPRAMTRKMEVEKRLIQLQQDAGFVPEAFDAQVLLDCDLDQVSAAGR